MEQHINIPTTDGFQIAAILNQKHPSKKLIIFVHGFKGKMDEAHYICGRDFFLEQGYDVVRFNLYHEGSFYRKLHTTTVAQHSVDVEKVGEYFSDMYEEMHLVGHSLGGPCIVGVSKFPDTLKKIVLWDPALDMSGSAKKIVCQDGRCTTTSNGKIVEVGVDMLREFQEVNYFDMLLSFSVSLDTIGIIYAENASHIADKEKTDKLGIESRIILGASHQFTEEGKFQELFDATLDFIEN